jgi:hypothetical protein
MPLIGGGEAVADGGEAGPQRLFLGGGKLADRPAADDLGEPFDPLDRCGRRRGRRDQLRPPVARIRAADHQTGGFQPVDEADQGHRLDGHPVGERRLAEPRRAADIEEGARLAGGEADAGLVERPVEALAEQPRHVEDEKSQRFAGMGHVGGSVRSYYNMSALLYWQDGIRWIASGNGREKPVPASPLAPSRLYAAQQSRPSPAAGFPCPSAISPSSPMSTTARRR